MNCDPARVPSTHVSDADPSDAVVSVVDAAPLTEPPPAVTVTVKLLPLAGVELLSLSFWMTVNVMSSELPTWALVGAAVLRVTV